MTSAKRMIAAFILGLMLIGLATLMVRTGTYGFTLFLALPSALGALAALVMRPKSASKAAVFGMTAD